MESESYSFFLDDRELALVGRVLEQVHRVRAAQETGLRQDLGRLAEFARLLQNCPPIATSWQFVGRNDIGSLLVDSLGRLPQYDFELNLPAKVALGQAFLAAKISFLRSLAASIDGPDTPRELRESVQFEIGQSIHTKMAEELFVSILTDHECARAVRVRAGEQLLRIWDDRLLAEVDDFAPLLEAGWQARTKVRPTLGAMLGAQEIYQLFQHTHDERFLNYFGRDDVPVDELSAFEEFIFGLSYEEIARLRQHISEAAGVVSHATARSVLGAGTGAFVLEGTGPQALFASYRRRRLKARYRALMHTDGPKRTAEEYVMLAYLTSSMEETKA